jgi:pimeloyl-ACP methyl ester carboxylesterase
LDTHIIDITQALEYEHLEIILVGHSYGGSVISGVAEKVPEIIRRLVYLDAYILQYNKSAFDIIPGLETIYKQRALKEQDREWLVVSYRPEEFGVTNSVDINWMNTRLCPMPLHTHQPIRIINPQAKRLSKSYISCIEFGCSQFKAQKSPSDWDYRELKTGHDAMITVSDKLVQVLEALI